MKHARKADMKKRVAAVAVAVVLLALVAGGTAAFFTSEEQAHNVITTKGVNAGIHEYMEDESGEWVDYPSTAIAVMPGDTVSKIPVAYAAENSEPAWVRMSVEVTVTSAGGEELDPSNIVLDFNDTDWTAGEDGWWYCNEALAAGSETAPLFEHVSMLFTFDNRYQGCHIDVIVSMQAVQTANNGATALEAAGWPATN